MSRIEISKFPYFFYLFCSFSPLFSYRFLRSVRLSRPCVALCFYTFFDLYTPFFPNLPSICTVFCPVAKSIYQRFFNNFRRFSQLFADFIEKFTLCARLFLQFSPAFWGGKLLKRSTFYPKKGSFHRPYPRRLLPKLPSILLIFAPFLDASAFVGFCPFLTQFYATCSFAPTPL